METDTVYTTTGVSLKNVNTANGELISTKLSLELAFTSLGRFSLDGRLHELQKKSFSCFVIISKEMIWVSAFLHPWLQEALNMLTRITFSITSAA